MDVAVYLGSFHFLMNNDIKHLFMFICHLYIFFGEMPLSVFPNFLIFLTVEF